MTYNSHSHGTVVSSANSSYATLAEYKAFATVRGASASTDAADDAVIENMIILASRYLDNATARRFWKNVADETRYYTPDFAGTLYCDDLAATPTTVKVDEDGDRTYSVTLTEGTDYDLMPHNAALEGWPYTYLEIVHDSDHWFPGSQKGVQIVGKFGFPSVPDDIKQATLGIVQNLYAARTGQTSPGNVSVTAAGIVIRPQDVPGWAQVIITAYRRLC
jgi:hypothetical protein